MNETQLSPKLTKKRRQILKVSRKIFAKEGFRNTDVQVIADLAEVGKGTIYRYFGNKEQLFLATVKASLDEVLEAVRKALGIADNEQLQKTNLDIRQLLRTIAIASAEYYQHNPQAVEIMIQERAEFRESVFPTHLMFRAEGRQPLEQLLRDGIARGEIRDVDVSQITNAFADLIYGSIVNGVLEGGKSRLVERLEHAMDLFLHGLALNNESAHPNA
jgi:AcrR family transcriptional regulator